MNRRLIRDICEWWANRPFWRAERRRAYAARCEPLEACLAGGAADAARINHDFHLSGSAT